MRQTNARFPDYLKSLKLEPSMPAEFRLSLVPKLKVWTKLEIEAAIFERTLFFTKNTDQNDFWFRIISYQQHRRTVSVTKIHDIRNPDDSIEEPVQVGMDSIIRAVDRWPDYLKTKRFK